MRSLFHRAGVPDVISLRNALGNHAEEPPSGCGRRSRASRCSTRATASRAGARRPDSIKIGGGGGGVAIPHWGRAARLGLGRGPTTTGTAHITIEGILQRVAITEKDFPLRPWHTSYDWNFFVEVDPQYRLVSRESQAHHRKKRPPRARTGRILIECEWESALVPLWAIPRKGHAYG